VILLILAVLVLLGLGGAGLLGIGVLSGDSRRERTGLVALLSAPLVLVAGAVLLAVLVLGVGGMQPGEHEPDRAPATTLATGRTSPAPTALPVARVRGSGTIPVIVMHATDSDRFPPYQPVSGLVPDAVVRVQVDGFDWHERGSVRQCVVELGHQTACGDPFPVQFDGDGRADFQFAVRGDIAPGSCRIGQPTCLVRVAGESGARQVSVQTVLVDSLTPGEVRIEPTGPLADGQAVEVIVTGFPPGTTATAVLCAPPEAYDARRCGPPEPRSTFAIDATGAGRTTLTVAAGRLGSDAALCGPRRVCGVAVVVGGGFVAAPITPVRFSAGPGVAYDGGRVLAGVLMAVVLGGAGLLIARRTDWTKPTEAATPELDGSDLRTDQSLDDLFGTDQQLDERDPILW
jgi:hypothetical protein